MDMREGGEGFLLELTGRGIVLLHIWSSSASRSSLVGRTMELTKSAAKSPPPPVHLLYELVMEPRAVMAIWASERRTPLELLLDLWQPHPTDLPSVHAFQLAPVTRFPG